MAEFEILAIGLDEADAPARFAKSFRETGFAILKDHNISADEIDRMYGVWTDFLQVKRGLVLLSNQENLLVILVINLKMQRKCKQRP